MIENHRRHQPLKWATAGGLRYLLLLALAVSLVSCRQEPPGPSLVPQDAQLAPPGFSRLGTPDFGIVYFEQYGEIHIYGRNDQENSTTVSFVPGLQVPMVRVELTSGGPASGDQVVEEFPLFAPWETSVPSNRQPVRLIDEILFYGGVEADHFENQTDIPSRPSGSHGNDTLIGGSSFDRIYGGSGNDVLRGGDGDDILYGSFGSDQMFGDGGNDLLKAVATGNDSDLNMFCGGDGADTLVGPSLADNRLDGELAQGVSDGDTDILDGHNSVGHFTEYEFNVPPDVLIENGEELDPDSLGFPLPALIPCG